MMSKFLRLGEVLCTLIYPGDASGLGPRKVDFVRTARVSAKNRTGQILNKNQ